MNTEHTLRVWDPLVRLFHWSLVICFAIAWFTRSGNYDLHLYSGYGILGLVVFRILWGIVGSHHARFSSFACSPVKTLRYLVSLVQGRARRYLGHNPAGAALIILMLLVLLSIASSGVALDAAENRAGPLAGTRLFLYTDLINEIHTVSTNVMLAFIALHLAGVLWSSISHRENLVLAMFTGAKRAADDTPSEQGNTHATGL